MNTVLNFNVFEFINLFFVIVALSLKEVFVPRLYDILPYLLKLLVLPFTFKP